MNNQRQLRSFEREFINKERDFVGLLMNEI
jgi:hypothetical protein